MTKRVSIILILLMIISLSSCSRLERHPAISKIFSLHDITQGEKDDFIKIYGKNISGQTFTSEHPKLSRIHIWLKRAGEENKGDLIFHLKDSPTDEKDIIIIKMKIADIVSDEYYEFVIPPQLDSKGKSYYFYLEAPDSTSENAPLVACTSTDSYPQGSRHLNEEVAKGDLTFKTYYYGSLGGVSKRFLSHFTKDLPFMIFYILLMISSIIALIVIIIKEKRLSQNS